jgi:hypothetical protein
MDQETTTTTAPGQHAVSQNTADASPSYSGKCSDTIVIDLQQKPHLVPGTFLEYCKSIATPGVYSNLTAQ